MIIVADPARTTADLLCRRLRSDGFEARAVATVPALMEAIGRPKVEAIIIDPALGAPESIVGRVHKARPAIPILAFGTSDSDVATTLSDGAGAFMVKGRVTPTQLVSRMRELIGGKAVGHRPGEMTGATEGSYYIQVDARAGDAGRLALDSGMEAGMRCPDCHGSMSLYLQRDYTRWGKWLFGTFGCLVCAKRQKLTHEMPVVQAPVNERVLVPEVEMSLSLPEEEIEVEILPEPLAISAAAQAAGWAAR